MYASMLNCFSRVQLFLTLMTIARQVPLSMGFSRQEYWSGLPFPSSGDLPHPEIEPRSPTLQADSLPDTRGKLTSYSYYMSSKSQQGFLFHMDTQGPRLMEVPLYHTSTFSTRGLWKHYETLRETRQPGRCCRGQA